MRTIIAAALVAFLAATFTTLPVEAKGKAKATKTAKVKNWPSKAPKKGE